MSKFARLFQLLTIALIVFGSVVAPEVSAQTAGKELTNRQITRTVADLGRAERAGDYQTLYDLMVPEARNLIPRQAFVNWWPDVAPDAPVDSIKIGDISFYDMTWELTDSDYGNVATVNYSYHSQNGETVKRSMQLTEVGGIWRWMPDVAEADLPAIQAMAGYTVKFESRFSSPIYVELDTFWAQIFADWDKEYRSPVDMIGVRMEGTQTGCGPLVDVQAIFAHYCTRDEIIYFNPDARDAIIERVGEAAWEMVMAHEWGHHIQNISGMYVTKSPELLGGNYSIEHELQADCLAGIFMQDATVRGFFDQRSRRETDYMLTAGEDAPGTKWDDITAHGTSDQRMQSYYTGFEDGLRGCHLRG